MPRLRQRKAGQNLAGAGKTASTAISHLRCIRMDAHLPNTEESDEKVLWESVEEHLRQDEYVGSQGGLEHDWHVASVEEFDGVGSSLTTVLVALDRNLDSESLEVDDQSKDRYCCQQIHDIWQSVAVEGLLQCSGLVVSREEQVEEGDEGSFEFRSSTSVDGSGRKRLPDDRLADVGRDKERDSRAETIALL